jgi:hypothetical protein
VGFLKQMKNMKDSVEAAPGMVRAAREMGAQAQEMAAAQQAAAEAQMANFQQPLGAAAQAGAVSDADLEPIAGVSIELYAEISKELSGHGYDQLKAPEIAATKGVSADNWATAAAGWNERIQRNRAIGQRFNQLYTGR